MRKMMPIRIVGKYVWSVWKLWRGVWNYSTLAATVVFIGVYILKISSARGLGLAVGFQRGR